MPVPSYFSTSPINGGTPLTINAPPVGGIVYDFVGLNDQRVTAYFSANDLPDSFQSIGTQLTPLNSSTLSARAINALGGGIKQLAIRVTIYDGDTAPRNSGDPSNVNQEYNTAFLTFNGISQTMNLSSINTYEHDGLGNVTNPPANPPYQGFPNELLSTGWGLITDTTLLGNIYNSIIANGNKIDLEWQSVNSNIGTNVIDFKQGLDPSIISFPSVSPNVIPTFNLKLGSDTGVSDSDGITAAPRPEFSGKSVPNDILKVYRDNNGSKVLLGTTTADATTGVWSFTPSTDLPEGTYDIIVDVVDNADAIISSANVGITIDLTPPPTPTLTTISTDSGTAGDRLTNDTSLILNGTAQANTSVDIFYDNNGTPTKIGSALANNSGVWSFDYSNTTLTEGSHTFTATASDIAGNVAQSTPFIVTIDTTAPTIPQGNIPDLDANSDKGSSNTDDKTNLTNLTFNGSLQNQVGAVVKVYDGNTVVGQGTVTGAGTWTVNATGVGTGSRSITYTVTDAAGNESQKSGVLTVDVNTTVPTLPNNSAPDLTAATDTGTSNTDNLTGDNTPTFAGTLTSAQAGYGVKVYDGNVVVGTGTVGSNGEWEVTTSGLSNGSHTIKYSIVEPVYGNESVLSSGLNVTIDATVPTAPTIAPDLTAASDTGVSNADDVTAINTPTFTGSGGIVGRIVRLYDGNTQIGEGTVGANGSWSVTTSTLAPGSRAITSTYVDSTTGNESAKSPVLNVTIDPNAIVTPSIPRLDLPDGGTTADGGGLTNNNKPPLTGTAEPGSTIQVFVGETPVGTAIADNTGKWTFVPSTSLADGTYEVTIKTTTAGITSTSPKLPLTIDTRPATVEILNYGAKVRDTSVNSLSFKFSEVVSNFDLSDMTLTLKGQAIDLTGVTLSTTDNQTWTLSGIPGMTASSGDYQIAIKAGKVKDAVGNLMQAGNSDSWLTGYTADAMAPIKQGGKRGLRFKGNDGNNGFRGGRNRDVLLGGNGNDQLFGMGGNDRLIGGTGDDRMRGGAGKDRLVGGNGRDKMRGGAGSDMLVGGKANDLLVGNNGDDILFGGAGKDTLIGGAGKDVYLYRNLNEAGDRIINFNGEQDLIDVRGIFAAPQFSGDNRFAQFHDFIQIAQVGANTEVRVDADGKGAGTAFVTLATLVNVNASTISSTNFVIG